MSIADELLSICILLCDSLVYPIEMLLLVHELLRLFDEFQGRVVAGFANLL